MYLPLRAHQLNRQHQSTLLRLQSKTLVALTEPPESRYEDLAPRGRESRGGLVEEMKARWNGEVEGAVRWVQEVDWRGVREGLEERVGNVWERVVRS
jgi:altered-inheritance-of-mitochondria protein 5